MPWCLMHSVGLFCHERPWASVSWPAGVHSGEVTSGIICRAVQVVSDGSAYMREEG